MGFNSLQSHIYFCPQSVSGVCLCILAVPCSFDLANKLDIISILGRVSVLWLLCVRLEESLKRSTCAAGFGSTSYLTYRLQKRNTISNHAVVSTFVSPYGDISRSTDCSWNSEKPQPPIILYYKLDLQANDENAKAYDKLTAPKGQARLYLLLHALLC